MKTFVCVGRNVGNQLFAGPVVASADTLYMLKEMVVPAGRGSSMATNMGGTAGGLIGGVIGSAIDGAINKSNDRKRAAFTTDDAPVVQYSKLPQKVTSHPDWPAKPKKDCEVICFSRKHVSSIKGKWPNRFLITAAGIEYKVDHVPFTGGKIVRFLREAGWPVG